MDFPGEKGGGFLRIKAPPFLVHLGSLLAIAMPNVKYRGAVFNMDIKL